MNIQNIDAYRDWYEKGVVKYGNRTTFTNEEIREFRWRTNYQNFPVSSEQEIFYFRKVLDDYVSRMSHKAQKLWCFRFAMGFFDEVRTHSFFLGIRMPRSLPIVQRITPRSFALGTPGIFDALECGGSVIRECSMEDAYCENLKVDAYRPKLDGVFFKKRGLFFEGPWFIPAPDTKIEEFELVGMDCFVLQPLGYRGGRSLSGHLTQSHGFSSTPEPSEEGIILLMDGVEFRIKRRPTTEVKIQGGCYEGKPVFGLNEFSEGLAEVCLSGTSLVFVRWRFGRKANSAPFEYFMKTPWLAQFDLKKTEKNVVYRYDTHVPQNQFVIRLLEDEVSAPKKKGLSRFINLGGLYKDTVSLLASTIILDCPRTGRQVLEGLDTLLSSDDFFRLETGESLTISFKNRTVMSRTVKLAFRSPLGVPFVMQGNKKTISDRR